MKKERLRTFVHIEHVHQLPLFLQPFAARFMQKTFYGDGKAEIFTQLYKTALYQVGEHRVFAWTNTELDPIPFEPGFYLHVAATEKTVHALLNGDKEIPLEDGKLNIFYLSNEPNSAPIDAGDYCFFHIGFGIEALRNIIVKLSQTQNAEKLVELLNRAMRAVETNGGQINHKKVELNPYMAGLMQEIMSPKMPNEKTRDIYINKKIQSFIECFLLLYLNHGNEKRRQFTDDDINTIDSIKGYIKRNVHKQHSLWSLSAKAAMHPERLNDSFRRFYGISIRGYLHHCRMEKAVMLLTETRSAVKTIASLTGYRNYRMFIERFTSFFGCSPSAFRRV